jgi:ribosomal protein S18 acetylase RimI-like enzyme
MIRQMPSFTLRALTDADYPPINRVLNDWWGGRHMSDMLPRLFFTHFADTSFVIQDGDALAGFLVGFLSSARPREAYIHFVGVNPDYRKHGVGRMLYEHFFERVRAAGRDTVCCVTAPINTVSIGFHTRMGFVAKPSETRNPDGVPYIADYDGPGGHRVCFTKHLT